MTPDEHRRILDGYRAYCALRAEHRTITLGNKNRITITPRLPQNHPWAHHEWELSRYLAARCQRCTQTDPHGLNETYWHELLCHNCATELGRTGGQLDHTTWPTHPTQLPTAA